MFTMLGQRGHAQSVICDWVIDILYCVLTDIANKKITHAGLLSDGTHFGGQGAYVFGARVAPNAEHHGLRKPGGAEFVEEGHAFLCARDSRKPIGEVDFFLRKQRFFENQFCRIHAPTGAHHAG